VFAPQDRQKLQQFSNLALLLTMVQDNHIDARKAKINLTMILAIIFPKHTIRF
jgi:hypothetical protein